MALWGTIVNAAAIVAGSLLGVAIGRMSESMKRTLMQGIGLALLALGVSMALKSDNFLLIVLSLVIGGLLGEAIGIERRLEQAGQGLERLVNAMSARIRVSRLRRVGQSTQGPATDSQGRIAAAFVNATLIYCIGAMAIIGSMDGGLRGDHVILYTKSVMDGLLSVVFATTMGIGVLFSAVPVLIYQGAIALGASGIAAMLDDALLEAIIQQVTAVGGVLIIGIGINILELRRIQVANLLPALLVAAAAAVGLHT
ncbi:DUF554 domain-containing protein [Paenibacillus sp. YYML68]|uniref:DUF554 domain-containing protein n=1 Tax=Paenibacillus sp. YYML68 TaxID=2909250 RepID=UPI002493C4ED|nr:DUF554 domain-containing protein [Paenibacillus sp. YYML68]